MSALMKKPLIKQTETKKATLRVKVNLSKSDKGIYCVTENGAVLYVPQKEVKHYQIKNKNRIVKAQQKIEKQLSSQLAQEEGIFSIFSELNEAHGEQGALLKGIRAREKLNQKQFCEKIDITQPELSKMENGKRPIGKEIARRLQKAFGVDYRLFL